MIHYIQPSDLESLQKFSKLFDAEDNFGLSEIERQETFSSLYTMTTSYKDPSSKKIGRGAAIHTNKLQAAFCAMGESIERYSPLFTAPDFIKISYKELKKQRKNALSPSTYKIYSENQAACKTGEIFNTTDHSKIDWTWFNEGFKNKKKILLPHEFCRFFKRQVPLYFSGTSSGNGCGKTPEAALLSGTYELLERDAVLYYWFTKNTPAQISLSNPDSDMVQFLKNFKNSLNKISLFHLKTDLSAHSILAVFQGDPKSREPYFAVSGACHLEPSIAIKKAMLELMHCVKGLITDFDEIKRVNYVLDLENSVWDFIDHVYLYAFTPLKKAYEFLFASKPQLINYKDLEAKVLKNPKHQLKTLAHDIQKNGYRIYNKNITPRDVKSAGFFIYRVFSPDFISIEATHRYRHLGCKRLYQLGSKLKLSKNPRTFADLNSYPHPFP